MWSTITIKDIIDILLVAGILYGGWKVLQKSGASNLFWGLMGFAFIWVLVSYILQLELTGAILNHILDVGVIAIIVIFQSEIRSFFYKLGARLNRRRESWMGQHLGHTEKIQRDFDQLLVACRHMSASKTGALMILRLKQDLSEYADTGEKVDGMISARLIENIFFKNTPLHDGAMILANGRVESAGCILPVSQNPDLPKHYGLRHRAALGLTERTDAIAIVVSEETGAISVAQGEEMHTVQIEELMEYLHKNYKL